MEEKRHPCANEERVLRGRCLRLEHLRLVATSSLYHSRSRREVGVCQKLSKFRTEARNSRDITTRSGTQTWTKECTLHSYY